MLHTKLPHNSLFPESTQQGETPGRDHMNEARRKEGALIAMETGSLALEAGRHYKSWTQGTGCDIMQAFREASCSGTSRQQRKEGFFYGHASPRISCSGFDFGCMNGMTGNLLPPHNPEDTSHTHKSIHTHAVVEGCLCCWMANICFKYGFLESCFTCNLSSSA